MDKDERSLLRMLAHVLLQNARPEKAAILLSALDVMEPEQPQVLRSLAVSLLRAGKAGQALETLDRLAIAGGGDAVFHLLRSQALLALDRSDEAHAAMQAFLAQRKSVPPVPEP
ncbi:tetratricopeptide repeat protein [Ramlibacter sp. MAHUQ-53]|uniref:type III secretion apparatus assembly chaperone SctY n=1 Tax=unclassified Ramlibacter TaxID=2617605 RepID=UPI0036448046